MLQRALTQPQQCSVDPLKNAQHWGIPIWATEKLQGWLEKIYVSLKDTRNLASRKVNSTQSPSVCIAKDPKVKHLKAPFIKFESLRRDTRPVFLELSSWPTLNFDGESGTCPFDIKRREDKNGKNLITKEVKENRAGVDVTQRGKDKEMTRRPRATATRARRTEQLVAGYCEICRIDYQDLTKHVRSDQHLNFVRNDDNFLSLDTLISAGASVEAFLQLNRAKEIGKDLFQNGGRSLRSVVLPEGKTEKTVKSELDDFGVEDIGMVQCNGARPNLNLKLNSQHNLRTRTKHESGHLLRSKGSPWHEVEKTDKFYEKFDGFTVKKQRQNKNSVWIEQDDEKLPEEDDFQVCCTALQEKGLLLADSRILSSKDVKPEPEDFTAKDGVILVQPDHAEVSERLYEPTDDRQSGICENEVVQDQKKQNEEIKVESISDKVNDTNDRDVKCNDRQDGDKTCDKSIKNEKGRTRPFSGRRGCKSSRVRHRLSVEERLIEDNRAYYKVEVLGNKLRSTTVPGADQSCKDNSTKKEDDVPSSEKPVVVRFKRVRKSELSLLSDEAESFMFGEPRRIDDSSEISEDESSPMPRETQSEMEPSSMSLISSVSVTSSPYKEEEDSQDFGGRARKRRRTQVEALIKDNVDYYKFETPDSRLRYQTSQGMSKDSSTMRSEPRRVLDGQGPILSSKPSPEVEKMQFSFETVPTSEPWYQTYQRQDQGAEFWHYFSEADSHRPFLLPYEIDNFQETLAKGIAKANENRRRAKGRFTSGRSPRKSPRCHASTLAIMSTIIRKREQPSLQVIEEESQNIEKREVKSDVDEELKEMARSIDEMLCAKGDLLEDSFEVTDMAEPSLPKVGPPPNLLELLDNCEELPRSHLENSSCGSSECGEVIHGESPAKRRKRRKNRTGWPGIKMRKKVPGKSSQEHDLDRENVPEKKECPALSERLHDFSEHTSNPGKTEEGLFSGQKIDQQQQSQHQQSEDNRMHEEDDENHENHCRESERPSKVLSRRKRVVGSASEPQDTRPRPRKRQVLPRSEGSQETEPVERTSRKRSRPNTTSSEPDDSENHLTRRIKCRRMISSSEPIDIDCSSGSERLPSGLLPTVDLEQRRSSIEFQPVVRMMKIDEQVDVDNSILSVTVASNRRLRSSGVSSSLKRPKKHFKGARGQFGRWIKNS
ncbi:uncharacterized protein LOC107266767 isoform X2 [Cephus cinctus]|nr:uncharacterized protein LOC107266767 isoform X2 [Cephus cinctus]